MSEWLARLLWLDPEPEPEGPTPEPEEEAGEVEAGGFPSVVEAKAYVVGASCRWPNQAF